MFFLNGRWPVSDTQIDIDDDYLARTRRLEAAEKLAARAARGEFDDAIAAHDAAKAARRAAQRDVPA
jgi:hypothetical protein